MSTAQPTPTQTVGISLGERLRHNPVTLKELRSRMRGVRSHVILTIYLVFISAIVSFIYLGIVAAGDIGANPETYQIAGKAIFGVVISLQFTFISFIAPALTAGAISSEREHQTYDLLRATLLSARSLVLGKFFSALAFMALLLFAAFPLLSVAFLLGGLEIAELLIGALMLAVTTLVLCAAGIFFSALLKRTLPATILTYLFSGSLLAGIPSFASFLLTLAGPFIGEALTSSNFANSEPSLAFIVILAIAAWVLIATNPMFAAIVSEMILIQEQSLFVYLIPTTTNGPSLPFISPWIGYCVFYIVISLIFITLSISIVHKRDRN